MMVDWQISRMAAIWGAGDSGPQAIVDILKCEDVLLFAHHVSICMGRQNNTVMPKISLKGQCLSIWVKWG